MSDPFSIPQITDLVPGTGALDVLRNQATAQVDEPTIVLVFVNRESVDVSLQIKTGAREVYPLGPAAINATIGDMPLIPEDLLFRGVLRRGDRIQVLGTNVNVAAQEIRVLVLFVALVDAIRVPQLVSVAG